MSIKNKFKYENIGARSHSEN